MPLIRRYLWAMGEGRYDPDEVLAGRYLCKSKNIFLDTKPGLLPNNSAEVPAQVVPYLRLSPWQLHVPQVYDWLERQAASPLLLLEQAALWVERLEGQAPNVRLLPALTDEWGKATALRQFNWLWQMANLWQPLHSEQVGSSLLKPELFKVEGSLFRLLELRLDRGDEPSLAQLGQLWQSWGAIASLELRLSYNKFVRSWFKAKFITLNC
ncbi:MAG: hypothetical protein HC781_04400 [Leptolyngbyaceae cyanobacterium CSU_1_4]|nr:hypothetical protein [Leptolyngbyaceae cyanobacterium CSU_1_4]